MYAYKSLIWAYNAVSSCEDGQPPIIIEAIILMYFSMGEIIIFLIAEIILIPTS